MTKPEKTILYNEDAKVFQYCDGTNWRTMLGGGVVNPSLATLTDVDGALAPVGGECLVYSSAAGEWAALNCAAAAGGDNLGNHSATQNIAIGTHFLSGDGDDEGISVDANGRVGIGMASPTNFLDVLKTQDAPTAASIANLNGGTTSQALVGVTSDAAILEMRSHALSRTVTRYGIALGGYSELLARGGNGLLIGTFTDAKPVVFGTNGSERMRIDSSGKVGIGMTPSYLLDINGTVRATAFLYASDARLKMDIQTLDGLDLVNRLRGVSFTWKSTSKPATGVIAQEVEQVLPAAVATDDQGMKAVDYQQLIGPLIEAVKTLKADNDALRARVEKLEGGGDAR